MLPGLRERGVTGLVIAPTMVWPEAPAVNRRQARDFHNRVTGAGLAVVGMQSLVYNLEGAALSGDKAGQRVLTEHLKRQADLAGRLGATSLIFGSPTLRREVNHVDAVAVFSEVAVAAAQNNTTLCIEPLSGYGNEFITTTVQGVQFVQRVREVVGAPGAHGVGLHLDSAAIAGQPQSSPPLEIAAAQAAVGITSFDASAPNLEPPSTHPEVPHRQMGYALRTAGFDGYVSLEMRPPAGAQDPVAAYLQEVEVVQAAYNQAA